MKRAVAAGIALLAASFLCVCGESAGDVFAHPLNRSDADFIRVEKGFSATPIAAAYTQTRTISRLNKSLASSGTMIVKPGAGIAWLAQKPYESLLLVGLEGMRQKTGERTVSMDAAGNQIYLAIAKALDGLFLGDFLSVEAAFDVFFASSGSGSEWVIGLIPKEKAMKAAIAFIEARGRLEGGRALVASLIMKEAGGDSILYEFGNLEARALDESEEALFSF